MTAKKELKNAFKQIIDLNHFFCNSIISEGYTTCDCDSKNQINSIQINLLLSGDIRSNMHNATHLLLNRTKEFI